MLHTWVIVLIVSIVLTATVLAVPAIVKGCRKREGGPIHHNMVVWKIPSCATAPIVVTSQTHTTATGYPATVQATPSGGFQATQYPTAMPMPQATGPYSNPPYPMGVGAQGMPQPMTQPSPYPPQPGFQGNVTPYPPAPAVAPSQMNPPSYDQVVGSDTYSKQAPYNPNYVNN